MRAPGSKRGLIAAVVLASLASTQAHAANPRGAAGTVMSESPRVLPVLPAETTDDGAAVRSRLQRLRGAKGTTPEVDDIRTREMANEAASFGMRAGVAWRYGQIEEMLRQNTPQIDIIFNFAPLLIDDVGMPPILSEYRDGYRLEAADLASSTQLAYRIEHGARLVSSTPTWRNFLLKGFPPPEDPHPAILPRTREEVVVWERGVAEGWTKGLVQADRIFDASLNVMTSTLRGMILYHRLVREGVMSPLRVARTPSGIEIRGEELDIGRVIYRVPDQPGFRAPDNWKPLRESTDTGS